MHRRWNTWASLITVGLLFGSTSVTRAQDDADESGSANAEVSANATASAATSTDEASKVNASAKTEDRGEIARIGAEISTYVRDDKTGTNLELSPLINGSYGLGETVDLRLDWGFAFRNYAANKHQGSSWSTFAIGNPALSVRRNIEAGRTNIYVGAGVAAPASWVPSESKHHKQYTKLDKTYRTASAMRGQWDKWLWKPEHVGLFFPIGVSMVTEDYVLAGAEAAAAILIPAGDYMGNNAEFLGQLAGEWGFGFEHVGTGLRFQGAWSMGLRTPDGHAQFSVGPFVRWNFDGGYLSASALANLDEPAGAIGNGADIWSVTLGGGATF